MEVDLRRYEALETPREIARPEGKVFSTNPSVALVNAGGMFVLKGPQSRVVFAESACYDLANLVGLDVPEHGLCTVPGQQAPFFCCRRLRGRFPIDFWFDGDLIANPDIIPNTIAFDVWTANWDRNIGNFVEDEPEATADGRVRIYAIDFEKAAVLRGEPDQFAITAWDSKKFWPTEYLGRMCRRFAIPDAFCDRIASLSSSQVAGVLEQVRLDMDLADITWLETAVTVLARRAANLHTLVGEAWNV